MTISGTTCTVTFVSAIALVAIAAQLVAGAETCPSYNTNDDVYNLEKLPFECSKDFGECAIGLCKCLGADTFSTSTFTCQGGSSIAEATCEDMNDCSRLYTLCVAVAANNTNATCAGDWYTFVADQIQQQLTNPDAVNSSALFDSCSGYVCGLVNATHPDCAVDYEYVCKAPFTPTKNDGGTTLAPLPPGANVPIPTTVNGAPAIPVTRVSALVIFSGDFSALFAKGGAAITNLKNAVAASFTKKFARLFLCLNVAQGSLQATVATDVPQGQSGAINAVVSNIKSLNSDSSSDWYAAIVNTCQSSGACSSGVGSPTVKLSSITLTDLTAASNPPVQQKCGSGCVAGIIIACVAVALIITVLTVVIVKRSSRAGTGTANEPTEEMKPAAGGNANAV